MQTVPRIPAEIIVLIGVILESTIISNLTRSAGRIWIIEVTRVSGSDKEFVWHSLMVLLDAE